MKSAYVSWQDSLARLAALKQLRGSIEALRDYPLDSREAMLNQISQVINEEEAAATVLEDEYRRKAELQGANGGANPVSGAHSDGSSPPGQPRGGWPGEGGLPAT
jgi:hypothetical protein